MIIDCISDLHGFFPKLDGGDLLIIAGDLTASHTIDQLEEFNEWVRKQKYDKKILVAGNHDTFFESDVIPKDDVKKTTKKVVFIDPCLDYLCDSGIEYMGLKIWGSPWTKSFVGMNPDCKAFTFDTEEELKEKFDLIPDDIDILITHGPPYGILDLIRGTCSGENQHVGSTTLRSSMFRIKPKLMVYGHVHENYGKVDLVLTHCINASIVNEKYQHVNERMRVIL